MKWFKTKAPDEKTCSSQGEKWLELEDQISSLEEKRSHVKSLHTYVRNPSESQRLFFEIQHLTAEISRAIQVQQEIEVWLSEQGCEGWGGS